MRTARRYAAAIAVAAAAASVLELEWWAVFVVLPALAAAHVLDPG